MKLNAFQKLAITTVVATLFLILVGGLVRSSGAGMGCPDWPKCFGQWIPPTSVTELPDDYKSIYLNQRLEKNEKVAGYLEVLGFQDISEKIINDPSVRIEQDFNATKTWIEYLNRLVGVFIGFLILMTSIFSIRYFRENIAVTLSSFVSLILVIFQGWLGSIVVSTNLLPGMITVHMILAMIIVTLLIYASFKASQSLLKVEVDDDLRKKLKTTLWVILGLSVAQMVLGTQVREEIDVIKEVPAELVPPRSAWIGMLGEVFEIHRTFSWLLVISGFYLGFLIWKEELSVWLNKLGIINVALIFAQIVIGIGLAYLDVPRVLQVLHLVGIALMICGQFLMILMLNKKRVA